MGDFNVACGVSHISIGGGDPAVLIPLTKTKHSDSIDTGAYYVSNDGPIGRYRPITLPIFGEYNSYGTLENIEKNCHTEALENHYGCSIENFVQHICSSHHSDIKDNAKVPATPYGMYVRREVYELLANKQMDEWGRYETAYKGCDLSSFILKFLGFVEDKSEEHNIKERYNRPFKHEKIPNLIVWSDGTWNEFQVDGKLKTNCYIYHPKDFEKFLKKNKMFVPTDKFNQLKQLKPGDIAYDKDCEKLLTLIKAKEIKMPESVEGMSQEKLTELVKAMSFAREYSADIRFIRFGSWYEAGNEIKTIYKSLLENQEFKKMFVNYKTFERQLWLVNTPLMPSWAGVQYGCHNATLKLANLTAKLCRKRIKELKGDE